MAKQGTISSLVVEELFSRGDDQWLERLRQTMDLRPFLIIVRRWVADPRPWARQVLEEYVSTAERQVDRLLLKRLFKAALHLPDPDAVAIFVVPWDRSIRRRTVSFSQWDSAANAIVLTQALHVPITGELAQWPFSAATRCYLRRSVWRYYRRMGFRLPDRYVPAVCAWLRRYEDADLATGANLLDSWSLMHACFGKSDAIAFNSRHTNVREASGLSRLTAAPMFERLWERAESAGELLALVAEARSRAVRVWAIQMVRRHHLAQALQGGTDRLAALLQHPEEEVQLFGLELLDATPAGEAWPIEFWLNLMQARHLTVLNGIREAFLKRVPLERLSLEQAVTLAISPAVPVARLGLQTLRSRPLTSAAEVRAVARLAGAMCQSEAYDLACFAIEVVGAPGQYELDAVSAFFDAPLAGIRKAAIEWLTPDRPGYADAALYARLLETPFDDVRRFLIAQLTSRAKLPGASAESLAGLWATVMLNIHRGGRAKLTALRQISEALSARPDDVRTLLPVMAVAIRSVRTPEARAGLSAVVRALEERPELTAMVNRLLPELILPAEEVAR